MSHQHLRKLLADVPGAVVATGAGKGQGHTLLHCSEISGREPPASPTKF